MSAKGHRWPSWRLSPHGTPAAYRRHYRHGEKPCQACREANALDCAARKTVTAAPRLRDTAGRFATAGGA